MFDFTKLFQFPTKETIKYDLQIIGMVLIGLPAYFNDLPILNHTTQQIILLASVVYSIVTGMARPSLINRDK